MCFWEYVFNLLLVEKYLPSKTLNVTDENTWKILKTICHVFVPGSSDFQDLPVVFSAHVLYENKKHVYLSGKI